MRRTEAEKAQSERFEAQYVRAQSPVILAAERGVCGCDYGGTSWTTREEADRIGALLGLRPGTRLLDLGAGSGWPALYLAKTTACDAMLVDIPLNAMRIAAGRARLEPIRGDAWFAVADAAELPLAPGVFDAISHSDLLCCLMRKRATLAECRRAVRDDGRMAFTVISVVAGLAPAEHDRAVASAPEFVESEADYPTLLEETGWALARRDDVSADFAATIRGQIRVDDDLKPALMELLGASEFAQRSEGWHAKLASVEDGLLRRELYVAEPRPSAAPRRHSRTRAPRRSRKSAPAGCRQKP